MGTITKIKKFFQIVLKRIYLRLQIQNFGTIQFHDLYDPEVEYCFNVASFDEKKYWEIGTDVVFNVTDFPNLEYAMLFKEVLD